LEITAAMALGIVGHKRGMTRIFTEDGSAIPVTVIEALPNRVTRVLTKDERGYSAVQVTWGERPKRLNKPESGVFAKAGIEPGQGLVEFRLADGECSELKPGTEIKVELFAPGQKVDVTGVSIGKGFAGVIKRHHFGGGRASHGNSLSHRAPGSIGQRQTPGRVYKGKRMAGHMGNARRTAQNLEVIRVDADRNLLLIRGAVPGARGGRVTVQPSIKSKNRSE
jgi:large subunit ribosomal protein L3